MRSLKMAVLAGSVRSGSFNSRLSALVGKRLAILDADVKTLSLRDYPLPIFDGDLENRDGVPDNARKLKRLFLDQDAIFIACPEYNAGITPLLKNALDWISRSKEPGEEPMAAFRDRVFAIGSASTGKFGGMRGLIGMRTIMEVGLGATVLPQMISVPQAATAFDAHGDLADEGLSGQLDRLVKALIDAARLR